MKWRKVDAYHAASDCNRYTVTRTGPEGGIVYQAWRGKIHLLTVAANGDEVAAKKACAEACKHDKQRGSSG